MQDPKEIAGRRAAEMVEDGMTLGLGTGSTVYHALVRLAQRIREEGLAVRGVPTSLDTDGKSRALAIPVVSLDEAPVLDLTIDGADEVDPRFNLTKGGGGALLREKVVASASRRVVIVVGRDKLVERLGASFPLPVEVVPFARAVVERELERLGAEVRLRERDGRAYRTDNGNAILDARFPEGIADPATMEVAIDRIAGVVESGLFVGLAHAIVVADADGSCEVRERP